MKNQICIDAGVVSILTFTSLTSQFIVFKRNPKLLSISVSFPPPASEYKHRNTNDDIYPYFQKIGCIFHQISILEEKDAIDAKDEGIALSSILNDFDRECEARYSSMFSKQQYIPELFYLPKRSTGIKTMLQICRPRHPLETWCCLTASMR